MTGDGGEAWAKLSWRDGEVLGFVARFGVVPRDAAAAWAGTGSSTTAARERRLREAGLLRVEKPLPGEPFLTATRLGLDACGHGDLLPATIALVRLAHFSAVAHLAVRLEAEGRELLSERELLAHERAMGERIFSVTIPGGSHHRPDLILLPPGHPLAQSSALGPVAHDRTREQGGEIPGDHERRPAEAEDMRPGAVEVELTPKGSARLDSIVTAWREAVASGRFSSVRYLCSEEVLPFVRRSVDRTGSGAAVAVGPLLATRAG